MQVLWQCGKYYKPQVDAFMAGVQPETTGMIRHHDFIGRMDLAYAAADVVISRAGASSESELCAAHKAVIFVPSPNVAEDHQTHNATALVKKDAALLVTDAEAPQKLLRTACGLLNDPARVAAMEENIGKLARPEAADAIVREIYSILKK